MHCLNCGETAGLDRVVLDALTEVEIGGLCDPCLSTCSHPVFRDDVWRNGSGCAVCAEPVHYRLPLIDCRIQYTDGRPDEVEYSLTDATLRLCTDHLRATLEGSPPDLQTSEAMVSQ
jgi:hypothetical protein